MRGVTMVLYVALGIAALLFGVPVAARPHRSGQAAAAAAPAGRRSAALPPQVGARAVALATVGGSGESPALELLAPTRLISIPYGFDTPLLLNVERQTVAVSGPGACTAGEQVTIELSVAQEGRGATAAGQTELACTGANTGWSATAATAAGPLLAPGPARACGVATTRDGETVTDSLEWCRDVTLLVGVYLPLLRNG